MLFRSLVANQSIIRKDISDLPLIIFNIGNGNLFLLLPPKYLYNGISLYAAAALALAIETAKIALAPNLFLLSVPSSLSSAVNEV